VNSVIGAAVSPKISYMRFFLTLLFVLALSIPAEAQQPGKMYRIGFLVAPSRSFFTARMEGFRQGLRNLGYIEGKNILIEYRYAEGKLDRLPELAAELVSLKVDLIVTSGPASLAAKNATKPSRLSSLAFKIRLLPGWWTV
jgi:putative tryptophan/tyrosine transport system substrate-binding protein